jgi:hypothetical protein
VEDKSPSHGKLSPKDTITAIQGSWISVTANSPQFFGNTSYVFSQWCDGGAVKHGCEKFFLVSRPLGHELSQRAIK